MKRPDPPSDRDIQEAYRALDGTLGDGQLDDFSSRVLARLDEPEASGMDSRELARGSGVGRPDEAAMGAVPEPAADENSGLHEIKALASTTRRRISQKITSDKEGEESLLVGASSGSFRAAALPDPVREKAAAPARDVRPIARPASEVERHPTPSRSSSAPFWLLGGVATAAAAAAVAVFVFGVGREKNSKQAPATDVVARTETTTASPAVDQGAVPGNADMKFAEPPPPPAAEPMAPAESAPVAAGAATVTPDETVARGDQEGGLAKGRAGSKAEHAEPAKESRAQKESEKGPEKKAPPAGNAGGKNDGKDLDDVLDQVAGKVDKPAQVDEEAPRKPSKKELDRADVSKAMGAVRASVMRCRDKEQFEGTVTVKFQVSPSGQVTSAEATGSKAGSPTGACVAAAVKKAKFPAFDGAPTSFTYPFLLAE